MLLKALWKAGGGSAKRPRSNGADARERDTPESSQRVGAQEVVEADVLVSCHVDHLDNEVAFSGTRNKTPPRNRMVTAVPSDR